MRKLGALLFISTLVVVLSACGTENNNGDSDQSAEGQELQAIEVNIKTLPETLNPEEVSTIQAKVTQGSENVNDAEEVEFELWKKGSEEHLEIEAEKQGKGLYSIQHTFDEKGIYYVIAHVTARDMHTMPQKKLNVGNVSESDKKKEEQQKQDEGTEEGHNHDQSTDGVAVHITKQDGKLMVQLEKGEDPLKEANVRFEVWQGDGKHQFIDAKEGEEGEYTAEFKPESNGTYKVNVHYEKGDLHGHQKKEVEYK